MLICNYDDVTHDVHIEWWQVGSECRKDVACTIRDVYNHKYLAVDTSGGYTCVGLLLVVEVAEKLTFAGRLCDCVGLADSLHTTRSCWSYRPVTQSSTRNCASTHKHERVAGARS